MRIAEQRIREAQEAGAFDNLPGKGKPLRLEAESGVPEELRMGFKILKNAGLIPAQLELRKEVICLQDLLSCCDDEPARVEYQRRLSLKRLQLELAMKELNRGLPDAYLTKVHAKLG